MAKRTPIILLFLCFCLFSSAQSGQLTAYERGRYELANTALKKVTEPLSSDQQLLIALVYTKMKKNVEDIFDETTVMENIVFRYCKVDGKFVTDANRLPDFQYPEKNLIGNYPGSWQETGKWYSEERLKLDASKTDEDKSRERERNNYKKGKGDIINNISRDFVSWAMSRRDEDDTSYHLRLKAHAIEVFDSLAYRYCDKAWKAPMLILKGIYDNGTGNLQLKYYNCQDPESKPLSGVCAVSSLDAANFDVKQIDENESHALGLSFREGLCYPSTLFICYRGVMDELELKLSSDDGFTIRGDEIKVNGTKRFVDSVTPYLKNHVFDYSEYAASRIYRNVLYARFYKLYSRYVRIAGADPGIRLEQFMPEGPHFSRRTAEQYFDAFGDYCLVAAQKGLYGRNACKCTAPVSLEKISDVFKTGSDENCFDAAGRIIDSHISKLAAGIDRDQVKAANPQGELADALALIFGMYFSGTELDVNARAKLLVEGCRHLSSRYNINKARVKADDAPYVRFLLDSYPEFTYPR